MQNKGFANSVVVAGFFQYGKLSCDRLNNSLLEICLLCRAATIVRYTATTAPSRLKQATVCLLKGGSGNAYYPSSSKNPKTFLKISKVEK